MVDAVVSYAIENVGNFLSQEGKLLFGVRDQVEAMQIQLKWMHCFLIDAEKQKGESHLVRNWVEQIQTLAYDVEDVIEHFVLKSALRNRGGIKNLIHRHSINRGAELHQTGSRIEGIKAKLSDLREDLKTYGIREIKVGGEETAVTGGRRKRVNDNIKSFLRRRGRKENGLGVMMKVLESSYDDLPYFLKSCFLYFSQYPEDAEIKTTELKQKWIGEGFISQSMEEGDETMEDILEEYLNELLSRGMIQVGRKGYTGRVKTCHMHDMIRDLCIEKAKEEGFAHSFKAEVENDLDKVSFRRLSIFFGGNKLGRSILPSSHVETFRQLRSIGFYDAEKDIEAVKLIVKKLKFTRVLQITGDDWDLGDHIGNLIHLRCLIINLPVLPRSIGNLRLLQTLNMKKCKSFITIPDSIWGLEQLRHLYLPPYSECESNKQRVGDFRNLQTLVNFPPEMFDLRQHLVKFACVRKLIVSYNTENIMEEASRQGIVFTRLQSLLAGWEYILEDLEAIKRVSPHLHKLSISGRIDFPATCSSIWPINLTKLYLHSSKMDESHMVSLAKLENLKLLFLDWDAFIGKEFIFHRNDFPKLHHLQLVSLPHLETWVIHEGALPRLSSLEMVCLISLKSVPEGTQFLKQLKLDDIQVKGMPDSFMKSMPHWGRVSEVPPISCTNYCDTEPDREKAEDGDEIQGSAMIQERDAHVSCFHRYFFSLKSLSFIIITCLTFIFVLFQV